MWALEEVRRTTNSSEPMIRLDTAPARFSSVQCGSLSFSGGSLGAGQRVQALARDDGGSMEVSDCRRRVLEMTRLRSGESPVCVRAVL
jgi:hypothetical protein